LYKNDACDAKCPFTPEAVQPVCIAGHRTGTASVSNVQNCRWPANKQDGIDGEEGPINAATPSLLPRGLRLGSGGPGYITRSAPVNDIYKLNLMRLTYHILWLYVSMCSCPRGRRASSKNAPDRSFSPRGTTESW
jgi:hypothetical protein